MSERKVLNKYYPPDFDPTKIPKLKQSKNRTFNIRIMAPFNMRCNVCGEYIYKGKKFNSRKENVEDEFYLGLRIFRFYIKCPRCIAEISFKTDPQNTDYELEAGATRNFEALRTAEKLAEKEMKEKEEEVANNPMKLLEKRTQASRQEMEMLETLEELRELNTRQATVDYPTMLKTYQAYEEQLRILQEDEDESFVQSLFGKKEAIKRLRDDSDDEGVEDDSPSSSKLSKTSLKPTDILTTDAPLQSKVSQPTSSKAMASIPKKSIISSRAVLSGLVRKKSKPAAPQDAEQNQTNTVVEIVSSSTTTTCVGSALPPTTTTLLDVPSATPPTTTTKVPTSTVVTPQVTLTTVTAAPSGLGLLGAYSDSEDSEDT